MKSHPLVQNRTDSKVTDHRMNLYSLAAAAAGVSVLALAQPAESEIIVTRKTIHINEGAPVSIDLNKDGIADFEFSLTSYRNSLFHEKLFAVALTGGKVVGDHLPSRPGPYASALVRGAKIGPSAHFSSSGGQITIEREDQVSFSINSFAGNWYYVGSNRFLGVKFLIKGKTHFGWIRLTVDAPGSLSGTITGFAYETVPNKRLLAGVKPSALDEAQTEVKTLAPSLGMLALGADGMTFWRRNDEYIAPAIEHPAI
jgi:hypothetical protein